jgi:hypothetical protein
MTGENLMRKRIVLVLIALLVVALVPAVALAQVSDETQTALDELQAAVDGLGGDTVEDWVASAAAVEAALETLDAVADGLDTAGFRAALDDLGDAIEGGDLDEIAAASEAVDGAMTDLAAQAADSGGGDTTTTTAATPAGGVATGAGGTAGNDTFPLALVAVAAAGLVALGGGYALRRRSQN